MQNSVRYKCGLDGSKYMDKVTYKIEHRSGVTEYQQSNREKEVEWSINGVMET